MLPESFPAGTRFFEVNGVPVSGDPLRFVCTAWDVPDGRPFGCTVVDSDGVSISEAAFRELVATFAHASS
jgi:hypothetical protein